MTISSDRIYHSDPEIMSGTEVFIDTRVPVKALWDYLEGGHSVDEFVDDFPTVRREQAIALIELAARSLHGHARSA